MVENPSEGMHTKFEPKFQISYLMPLHFTFNVSEVGTSLNALI
jgi:hypothetical protein